MKKILVAIAAITVLASCADKRPEQFAQGQGNFRQVSDYDGKEFELETLDVRFKTNTVSSQTSNIDTAKIRRYDVVNYKTSEPLLGDGFLLQARPKAKFTLRYIMNDFQLMIALLAKPEDVDFQYTGVSQKTEDGRLIIPLKMFPVQYVGVERQKNSDGEETNTNIEVDLGRDSGVKKRAAGFRGEFVGAEDNEFARKTDVFPADIFTGEWFYSETLVGTQEQETDMIGQGFSVDQNLEEANRIKFEYTDKELKGLNLNIDERAKAKDSLNLPSTITIPIEWKEYKINAKGEEVELKERSKDWRSLNIVQVKLAEASTQTNDGKNSKVVEVELTDNYFSFTVERTTTKEVDEDGQRIPLELQHKSNIRVRYSFLRADERNYAPKQAFKTDMRKFGFFTSEKQSFITYERYREEDFEKNTFVSRFNPKNGEIVYYFTHNSPPAYWPIGRQAVQEWNDAFEKAGTGIRIRLDESKTVALGDLRYNTINVIESLSSGSLLGFGPKVSDPYTGEIISATANIHISAIKEGVVDSIRQYINYKRGVYDDKYYYLPPQSESPTGAASFSNAKADVTVKDFEDVQFKDAKELKAISQTKGVRKIKTMNLGREFYHAYTHGKVFEKISKLCASETSDYLEFLEDNKLAYESTRELKVIESCSAKLLPLDVMMPLVHEMGHNFGLRHNFYGSTDKVNFWDPSVTGTPEAVRSSSIMEYMSDSEEPLQKPGPYDIAAIRFGYADKIELQDGSIEKLDVTKSIASNLGEAKSAKSFKFCTDEDRVFGLDALCTYFDAGTTATEIMEDNLLQFNTALTILHRRDINWATGIPGQRQVNIANWFIQRFLLRTKNIYTEWRKLLSRQVGIENQYLESYTPEQYKALVTGLAKDPRIGAKIKDYYTAGSIAFTMLKNIAFQSNRYCYYGQNTPQGASVSGFIELEKVREEVYHSTGVSVRSCADAGAAAFIKDKKGADVLAEDGYFLEDIRYDMDPLKTMENPEDVIGMSVLREVAINILATRNPTQLIDLFGNFYPNFFDEPQYRNELMARFIGRAVEGLSLSDTLIGGKGTIPKFEREASLVELMMNATVNGLMIPGKNDVNSRRSSLFYTIRSDDEQVIKQAAARLGNTNIIAMGSQSKVAQDVINKANEITDLLGTQPIAVENLKILTDLIASSSLPMSDGSTKMTVKEYVAFMDQLIAALQSLPQEQQAAVAEALGQVIGLEVSAYQVIGQITAELADKPEELAKALDQDVVESFKEHGAEFRFFKDKANAIVDEKVKEVQAKVAEAQEFGSELRAQKDVLIRILRSFIGS